MKSKLFVFLFVLLSLVHTTTAQNPMSLTEPTLEDRFPKIIGGLRFSQTTLNLGKVLNNELLSDTIRIFNNSQKPLSLSIKMKLPDHLKIDIQPTKLEAGQQGYILVTFNASLRNEFGFVFDRIMLHTDDMEHSDKNLNISATISEFFPPLDTADTLSAPKARLSEKSFNYGRIQQGEKAQHDFMIYNDGQHDLKIHSAKSTCGCIKTSLSKNIVLTGDSALISVEFDSFAKESSISKEAMIFINDPSQAEIILTVLAEVWK